MIRMHTLVMCRVSFRARGYLIEVAVILLLRSNRFLAPFDKKKQLFRS